MYAVFEEVVGHQTVASDKVSDKNRIEEEEEDVQHGKVMKLTSAPKGSDALDGLEKTNERTKEETDEEAVEGETASSHYDVTRKRHRCKNSCHFQSPNSKMHEKNLKDGIMSNCETSSNPLLDTIKVITYDPCDDSDDYYDLGSDYEVNLSAKDVKGRRTEPSDVHQAEGDRESIGYAGSNSIDSGYKSFCPTPEMPDPSAYSPNPNRTLQGTGSSHSFYSGSSCSDSRIRDICKQKITTGSKGIPKQGSSTPRDSRRVDPNLYEVNLDHLMYLRQSLLSAIQKCESPSSKCRESEVELPSPTSSSKGHSRDCHLLRSNRKNSSTRSSCPDESASHGLSSSNSSVNSSPSYQKTVRFNADVKVSSLNGDKTDSDYNSTNSSNLAKRKDKELPHTQSKSILKDPLCENLRSKLQNEAADSTLEEEIDSLLYGRAEFYDLESVDDFPCSYVTMIEEKYRCGKPSLAKVRKLKGGKNPDLSKAGGEGESKQINNPKETSDIPKSTNTKDFNVRSISSSARCRFTEVARCMIEIIEDLQLKKLQTDSQVSTKDATEPRRTVPHTTESDGDHDSIYGSSIRDKSIAEELRSSEASCYASALDYHVYEEIAYDFISDKKTDASSDLRPRTDVPPPLPARPTSMFQKAEHHCSRLNSTDAVLCRPEFPRRRGRSLRPREDGSERNRPKQRSNLYSLFADQAERRNISRSLERESKASEKTRSVDPDDEYGFRKVFTSI